MARQVIASQDVGKAALRRLSVARGLEPDPLHGSRGEIVRYIGALQTAGQALQYALQAAEESGAEAERELLEHRLASVDAAVARQVMLAGRRVAGERREAISTLNAIFRLGSAPEESTSGPFEGQWVTPTISPAIDTVGRLAARVWSPWKGKRFHAESRTGVNIWASGMQVVGRLVWPAYGSYEPYEPGLVAAFPFRTYTGPGIRSPDMAVLKIDYDSEANPRFIVRPVLDELVQISANYYLGKWYVRKPDGGYRLVAFFALQRGER